MLTQKRLKELLTYDASTGQFVWNTRRGSTPSGTTAGRKNSFGHIQISVDAKRYLAHRLAWLYMFGNFPNSYVDHINRVPSDNRISNLRLCTRSQNNSNTGARTTSISGIKGVDYVRGKWRAQIASNGKKFHLGYFKTLAQAKTAYGIACLKHHGDFACVTKS